MTNTISKKRRRVNRNRPQQGKNYRLKRMAHELMAGLWGDKRYAAYSWLLLKTGKSHITDLDKKQLLATITRLRSFYPKRYR